MTKKEIGAILYKYYLDNYCESDFSFDKGETRNKIEKNYEEITSTYTEEYIKNIEEQIEIADKEGTNYDYIELRYPVYPDMFLQVTSLIDYDGNKPNGYTGDEAWADVGMFFIDYNNIDFDDLSER